MKALSLFGLSIVLAAGLFWAETHIGVSAPASPATLLAAAKSAVEKPDIKPYPFATCVVCGMKLDAHGEVVTFVQDGHEVKVCGQGDADEFKKNPAKYLAKIDQAYKDAKPYPLSTCVVMGDKLDDTAYSFVYDGRQFKLCCKSCLDDFQKDPNKFVKIWDSAAKTAK